MSNIQNVDSAPDYIMKFIHNNMEQLCKIYDEGMYNNPDLDKGIMMFQCSEKENKMDVQFMNEEHICETMQPDSWGKLKQSIPSGKKLFMIMDHDINSMFLVYI